MLTKYLWIIYVLIYLRSQVVQGADSSAVVYKLLIKVSDELFANSGSKNYVTIKGHLSTCPETVINENGTGYVDSNLLAQNKLVMIDNVLRDDCGVPDEVTLGNRGDSLKISFFGIYYIPRDLWSNITTDPKVDGDIPINSSKTFGFAMNGNFSSWSEWSTCSSTCGGGKRKRSRACNNPSPKLGGRDCDGDLQQEQECNVKLCPVLGNWCEWNAWSACSKSCGPNGSKSRVRDCSCPSPANGGASCPGDPSELQPCNSDQNCPIDGNWNKWSEWSPCSLSCGTGSQSRTRICNNPAPSGGGASCVGDGKETTSCKLNDCPVDGAWGLWSNWSSCSVTCGTGGTQYRTRTCDNPTPQNNGANCTGSDKEQQTCNNGKPDCPINGNWSAWSNWSSCSVTCDSGNQTRIRKCDSPAPKFGGTLCTDCIRKESGTCGLTDEETRTCQMNSCINQEEKANSLISDALLKLNSSDINTDKESMNVAFNVVNQLSDLLKNQLNSKDGGQLSVETPAISVVLASVKPGSGPSTLKSKDKGGITIRSSPKKSASIAASISAAIDSAVSAEVTTASPEPSGIAEFSALDSSTFLKSNSSEKPAAAMVGLKLGDGPVNAETPITVSLPNQNQQTDDDVMTDVSFNKTGKLIQNLMYESDKTMFQVLMDLKNATNYTIWFSKSEINPNNTEEADAFIMIFENKTMVNENKQINVNPSWDESTSILKITIPSKQVEANKNLTLIMFTASTNYTEALLEMKLGVASMTPREWNFALEEWQDSDADLSDDSDISNVNFQSNFLGTFSAKIFIPPNTINFQDIFANFGGKLAESFTVLVVLIVQIILYIIAVVITWRKDRNEAKLLRYEPLLDNEPEHEYSFIVSVFTSPCEDAGTSSEVFINVLGKWGSSGHRKVTDGYRKNLFSTGSVCNFVMNTESSLGELMAMRVWHNNTGDKAPWHLEKIIIEDLQTRKMYIFMCDSWLGEEVFDGKVERVLMEIKRDQSFQNLFYRMKVGGVMDRHVMMSLTRNTGVTNYTRVQKLSVLVTMFFLIMVTNAMFFGKDENLDAEANFKFDLGIISMTWFEIYTGMISVAITYPAIFLAAEIFRRTKRWRRRWTEDEEAKMKKSLKLPRGFLVLGWFILLAGVSASAFFTFFYSLEWGGKKSNDWLKTFFMGVIGMVFLTDPIILLFIYILAKKIFGAVSYDDELNIDDFVNEDVKEMLGAEMKEADKEQLEKIKKEKENSQKLSNTIHDGLSYLTFLLLLTALAYDARDQKTFLQNENIKNKFIGESFTIETYHDIYAYVKQVIEDIYPSKLYNDNDRAGDYLKMLSFCDCFRQGPFRLRQLRVKRNTCKVSQVILDTLGDVPCNEDYSLFSQQKSDFSTFWDPPSNNVTFSAATWNRTYLSPPEAVIDAFKYKNEAESGGYPFEGSFGYYDGGGYVATLGMKYSQADYVIRNLQTKRWIDKLTRAVFFEGTIYNPNTNLFTTVQVLFENPNCGGAFQFNFGVRSYRLYDYTPGKMIVLLTMQALYLLIVVITVYREIKKLIKQKCAYFKDGWNQLELFTIIMSVLIVITTAIRITLTIESITKLNRNKGFYVSFDNVSTWVEITCILMAICSFGCILRVLKYFGFNKHIAVMQATIKQSTSQLSSFALVLVCFMVAYVSMGTILFSYTNLLFTDIFTMARTLFGAFLGIVTFSQMFETKEKWDNMFFYYSWTSISVFFLVSVFVSILDGSYGKVLEEELYEYDRELVEHMWNKFNKAWTGLTKSVKYEVPQPFKRKAIAPVDLSEEDLQMSSRENIRSMNKKRVNPSMRRRLAELNGDKLDKNDLAEDERRAREAARKNRDEEIYVSSISFTDIQVAAASGSQLFTTRMEERSNARPRASRAWTQPIQYQTGGGAASKKNHTKKGHHY